MNRTQQLVQFSVVSLSALIAFAETRGDAIVAVVSYLVVPIAAALFLGAWLDDTQRDLDDAREGQQGRSAHSARRMLFYLVVTFGGLSVAASCFAVKEALAAKWDVWLSLGAVGAFGAAGLSLLLGAMLGARDVLRES